MTIRPIARCFGLAVMSGFAVTAHAATYNVTVLADPLGGVGNSKVFAINSLGESVGWSATSSGFDAVLWLATGTATVLQDYGGHSVSVARAINSSGEIAGFSKTTTGNIPVLWSSSSGLATPLGKGGGVPSLAVAINGKGESVGYVKTTNGYDAILWHPKGAATVLGDPGHQHFAQALAINGAGLSAGYACTTVTTGNCIDAEAVLWGVGGKATPLQDVAGGVGNYEALAINKTDYTVGWAATATGRDAVRWSPIGTATVLQGYNGSSFSEAVAENNHGLSIGYSDTAKGDDAILWGPLGRIAAQLRDPGGQGVEFALALNDQGQSVGYADTAGGGKEAVLWQASGKATNLGAILGSDWTNTEAVGINNFDDIVGYGHYNNGTLDGTFGFLLTPSAATALSAIPGSTPAAPEPSTWAMLVAGFVGLGLVGYRSARREARREVAWRSRRHRKAASCA